MICAASYLNFLLTHWACDRHRGDKLALEYVIRKQDRDTAYLFGLTDQGNIEPGKKADLNVIDLDALTLHPAGRWTSTCPRAVTGSCKAQAVTWRP